MRLSRIACALAALLCLAPAALASTVDVQAERIVFMDGKEFVPRFVVDAASKLVVPAGQTATLPEGLCLFDAVEVAGTLRVARTYDTVCKITHLQILPGGRFDMGTAADPALRRVEIVIRDIVLDPRDKFQWGNGILNFGQWDAFGRAVPQATCEIEDAPAGAQILTTKNCNLTGWVPGALLAIPDMKKLNVVYQDAPARTESPVTVASVSGNLIGLSKPLDFEHKAAVSEGGHVESAVVANASRNLIIRSENPNGVRGHSVSTGHGAANLNYVAFVDMGRTKNDVVQNPVMDANGNVTSVSNQTGRYAYHDHHVHNPATRRLNGVVLLGDQTRRWGYALHNVQEPVTVENSVCVGFGGACFTTEDGVEANFTFKNNFAMGVKGNGISAPGNLDRGSKGSEGAGFWFAATKGATIEGNRAYNNAIGINLFHNGLSTALRTSQIPASFADNRTVSNLDAGLEYWATPRFPAERHISAHNGQKQMFAGASQAINVWLKDPILFGSERSDGVSSSEAYVTRLEVDGGYIGGCLQAFQRGGAGQSVRIANITLQCVTNINFGTWSQTPDLLLENINHEQLGNHPKRFVVLGPGQFYPNTNRQGLPARQFLPAHGSRAIVKNWQGTGKDYRLYTTQQLYSKAAWPADDPVSYPYHCPEKTTVGVCWEKFGWGLFGAAVADANAVTLDGLINAVAEEGAETVLGMPNAVLLTPNMLAPARIQTANGRSFIRMIVGLNGSPLGAKQQIAVQIDGGPQQLFSQKQGNFPYELTFDNTIISAGTHTVKLWRVAENGALFDPMTFQYFVGEPTPGGGGGTDPEPEPEPEPTCTVGASTTVQLDGQTFRVTITSTACAASVALVN